MKLGDVFVFGVDLVLFTYFTQIEYYKYDN